MCFNWKFKEQNFESTAGLLIDYGVGEEKVPFVTLGLSTLFEFLYLFAINMLKDEDEKARYVDYLNKTIDILPKVIEISKKFIRDNLLFMCMIDKTVICGRDMKFGLAREAVLKLQETIRVPALHYESEEFLHGPVLQLSLNHSVFLIAHFYSDNKIQSINDALEKTVVNSIFITFDNRNSYSRKNIIVLPKPAIPELSQLVTVIFFQVLSAMLRESLNISEINPFTKKFREKIIIKNINKR